MKNAFLFINIVIAMLIFNSMKIYSQTQLTDITSTHIIGDASNGGSYGGHGIMFGDSDGDGDGDMYITMNNNAEMPDQYFENNGSGVFTEKASERGISNNDIKGSHGWVWADLDNDGDYDGWNGSYSKNIPYMNKNNQPGYFEDKFSGSGIADINMGTRGIVSFDYDKDGDLDLFANNWYARSTFELNEFYRNDGNFKFTRIDNGLSGAKGDQGVCDGDFDNDGDIDLLLSVFEGNVDGRCVEIWENVNGNFVKLLNSGLTLCNGSYDGTTFWDMDNDGLLDVVSKEKIFRNNGNKTFSEVSNIPSGSTYIYMRGIADLNNDGYWDLVVPGVSPLYINNGDMTFSTVSYSLGGINDPRCVSFSDIDGDGDVDFALGQKRTYNRLYRNDYSGTNRSLFVKLRTAENQLGAFGAKVYIYSEFGDTLLSYRQAHSSQGYLSQDDPTLHFGCGSREKVKVKVIFLNGSMHEFVTITNKTVLFPGRLQSKLFLSGAYIGPEMSISLQNNISLNQPYSSSPWNYYGNEMIDNSLFNSYNIVDWVLLELRSDSLDQINDGILIKKAALILSDGRLIDTDGSDVLKIWGIPSGDYYLVIKHRNHLSIISSEPISILN